MLALVQLAAEEIILSCPGMMAIWVLHVVLIPRGDGVANEILFCEQHWVIFYGVYSRIKLLHVLDPADKNCKDFLLVAAIVE